MISNSQIKYIQSLRQKKYRDRHGVFVAEGDKIVQELTGSAIPLEMVCGLPEWVRKHRHKLDGKTRCIEITEKELSRISSLKTPNQVLAVAEKPVNEALPSDETEDLVLVLDSLQDPGNLGTIIRTADWFGIRNIICSEGTADVYNPKVIQATMGSFIRTRIVYTDLSKLLRNTRRNIYGAFLQGSPLFAQQPRVPAALVIGNESRGISEEVAVLVNRKICIPRHPANNRSGSCKEGRGLAGAAANAPESLNAAIAAGIMMSWFRM